MEGPGVRCVCTIVPRRQRDGHSKGDAGVHPLTSVHRSPPARCIGSVQKHHSRSSKAKRETRPIAMQCWGDRRYHNRTQRRSKPQGFPRLSLQGNARLLWARSPAELTLPPQRTVTVLAAQATVPHTPCLAPTNTQAHTAVTQCNRGPRS